MPVQPVLPSVDHLAEPPELGVDDLGYVIYPMPAFLTLGCADPAASASWYVEALGFGVMFVAPRPDGTPMLVHLRRARYQDVLLVPAGGDEASGHTGVSFTVHDLDELATRGRAASAPGRAQVAGPDRTPWGGREVRITDPDGHELVFVGRPDEVGSLEDAMNDARAAL